MEQKTCYEMLKENVDIKKGNIIFYNHKISMKTFLRNIDDFAISLKKLNFNKNDVLTIYLPTCPQALVAFYACSKLGVIANIVHPLLPIEKLKDILKQMNSKGLMFFDVLVKNQKVLSGLNQTLIKCSIADYVVFRKPFFSIFIKCKCKSYKPVLKYSELIKHSKKEMDTKINGKGDNVVCRMHSGGTSGQPKIIELQNKYL